MHSPKVPAPQGVKCLTPCDYPNYKHHRPNTRGKKKRGEKCKKWETKQREKVRNKRKNIKVYPHVPRNNTYYKNIIKSYKLMHKTSQKDITINF